ncbi:MAG: response regulator [Candidatus Omnitrophica bacterium]|nr:response regulator [Candidatus Omnitrophota bacterium]
MAQPQILVADDEAPVRNTLVKFFKSLGVRDVLEAVNGEEAVQQARDHSSTLQFVLLDLKMPGKDGLKTLEEIRGFLPKVKIAILTGYPFYGEADQAVRKWDVVDFIIKPVDLDYLEKIIRTATSLI